MKRRHKRIGFILAGVAALAGLVIVRFYFVATKDREARS